MNCKNCLEYVGIESNYCSNCGQDLKEEINLKFILKGLQVGVLNFDRDFIYTFKNLFLRPKLTVDNFIGGRIKSLFHPITFLLVICTYELLFYNSDKINIDNYNFLNIKSVFDFFISFISYYSNLSIIFSLPIFCAFLHYFTKKSLSYSFYDILIIESFIISIYSIYSLFFYFLMLSLNSIIQKSDVISYILSILIFLIYHFIIYKEISSVRLIIFLSTSSILFALFFLTFIFFLSFIISEIYSFLT